MVVHVPLPSCILAVALIVLIVVVICWRRVIVVDLVDEGSAASGLLLVVKDLFVGLHLVPEARVGIDLSHI